ncbi:MAG TPA: hypothetical protein VF001_07625 [Candidatus Limnocylindria bacterium]
MASHPIDVLLREIYRIDGDHGGQDVVNLAAAIINVAADQGTAIGAVPEDRLGDMWTLAVCHRLALSLQYAFTSRDASGGTWRRFVRAWERAHLERHGYFDDHAHAFPDAGVS